MLKLDEQEIFHAARRIALPEERRAYLDSACANEPGLRARVEALLRVHDDEQSFLRSPAEGLPDRAALPLDEGPGTIIGSYKLLEQIGEGGFGVVFMAEQQQPVRRKVALKVVKPGMDTRQVVARFEAERQALALMDHPNIARVLDGGETASGRPYFVMELVRGVPITDFCDENHLGVRRRLELFVSLCQAVQHAHQKGVIHRDVKPSNVLVTLHDGVPVPKVIDFGIAKAMGEKLTDKTLFTGYSQMVGTPLYMSPEQAEMSGLDVDTRSDIYSLGVLLYELLTGTTPFDKDRLCQVGFDEMRRIIREEEPPRPSARMSTLTEVTATVSVNRGSEPKRLSRLVRGELDWIVMKCLEKDRSRRYETASGLARDIQHYLNEEPVEACPPSVGYKLRTFARKHRKLIAVAGTFMLLLTVGIGVSTWQAVRATLAERATAGERDKAVAEKTRADEEAGIARALTDFLQHDLLGQTDLLHLPIDAPRNRNQTVRELLDRASKRIDGKFPGQERTEAEIRTTIGKAYVSVGEYAPAEKHLGRALALRKSILGNDHLDTLRSTSNLASLCFMRGNYSKSETLCKEAWEGLRAQLGDDHPETLAVVNTLAMLDGMNGWHDSAEGRYRQIIERFGKMYGVRDRRTLHAMYNLAVEYNMRGKFREAERLAREVVASYRMTRGASDAHTLRAMNYLGTIYLTAREYAKAEPLYKDVLKARRETLDANHPDTLTTMRDLGFVYLETNRLDDAESLFDQSLKASRVNPGPEHPLTLEILSGQATLYTKRCRYEEAESIFKRLVESKRRTLGPDNPETLRSINNLGAHYLSRKLYDRAEPHFLEASARARTKLGVRHPFTKQWIKNLANVYDLKEKHSLAEPLHRELAEVLHEQAGSDSLPYADALGRLVWNLVAQKKYAEAEPHARNCLTILTAKQPDIRLLFDLRSLLIAALLGQQKYAQAEPLLLEGFEVATKHEATLPKHRLILTLERLVWLYEDWGKPDQAARWRKELKKSKEK